MTIPSPPTRRAPTPLLHATPQRRRFPASRGLRFRHSPRRLIAHVRPYRVRHPTDWSLPVDCSPPRLAATQLSLGTGRRAYARRGLSPPCHGTIAGARRGAGRYGRRVVWRGSLPEERAPLSIPSLARSSGGDPRAAAPCAARPHQTDVFFVRHRGLRCFVSNSFPPSPPSPPLRLLPPLPSPPLSARRLVYPQTSHHFCEALSRDAECPGGTGSLAAGVREGGPHESALELVPRGLERRRARGRALRDVDG